MSKVYAVYEKGVVRPLQPVPFPENCEVVFEPEVIRDPSATEKLRPLYSVLSERYESGASDAAARHSEHQP